MKYGIFRQKLFGILGIFSADDIPSYSLVMGFGATPRNSVVIAVPDSAQKYKFTLP